MSICKRCAQDFIEPGPFEVGEGNKDDNLCHGCAHAMIAEARGWLDSFVYDPEIVTVEILLRELKRVRKALLVK